MSSKRSVNGWPLFDSDSSAPIMSSPTSVIASPSTIFTPLNALPTSWMLLRLQPLRLQPLRLQPLRLQPLVRKPLRLQPLRAAELSSRSLVTRPRSVIGSVGAGWSFVSISSHAPVSVAAHSAARIMDRVSVDILVTIPRSVFAPWS